MKQLPLTIALVLALAACGKDKPKAATAADAGGPVLKQDDELAAKLAAAYPKIRCALAANQNAVPSLYTDAGFANATEYFQAFTVQAEANPAWARKVTSTALAKPCVEPPAATAPPVAAPAAAEPPSTGNTP